VKLQAGERLTSFDGIGALDDPLLRIQRRNAAVYVVGETLAETPWYGLYRAKKVFRNIRSDGQELEEADEAEWLDVLLKSKRPSGP
jgi:hypothetical protein